MFTPNGRHEFVPSDKVFPFIVVYCLLLLLKNKLFQASFIHKNCSGQFHDPLIFCCEKFSTSISRLPFAINVTLNLSKSDFVPWHVLLSPLPFTIKPVFSQPQAKDPFFLRHLRLEGQDFPILSHSSISETDRVEKWIINPSSFGWRPDICNMRRKSSPKNFLINRSSSKPFFFHFSKQLRTKTFNRAGYLNKV